MRYQYYAIRDPNHTLDNPLVVIREREDEAGHKSEEMFSTALRREESDVMHRLGSGRDWQDEAVPIGEEAAKRFESTQADRVRRANSQET